MQTTLDLPKIKRLRSGKVREVFDLGETLLFVATDRISAFDVILPDPIPKKGAVLNQLSAFWFKHFEKIANHFVTAEFEKFPDALKKFREQLAGRSMIVKKAKTFAGRVRGARLSGRFRMERIPGIAKRVRNQVAARLETRVATARTDFYARNEVGSRPRHQYRLERMLPESW